MANARKVALVAQGEQTREMLLGIAIDLFGRFGYQSCSLGRIATEAGVVQSALLYHFGSKEKLLMTALLEHYPLSANRPDIEAIRTGSSTFAAEIERATRASVQTPGLIRFFSVMAGESLTEAHPAHAYFVQRYDTIRDTFAEAVMTGAGLRGERTRERIVHLVTIAFATMDGLQAQWLRNPSIDLIDGVREAGVAFDEGIRALRD